MVLRAFRKVFALLFSDIRWFVGFIGADIL